MPSIRKLNSDDFNYLLTIETESFSSGYSPYFIKMIPILFGNTSYIAIKGHSPQGLWLQLSNRAAAGPGFSVWQCGRNTGS